MTDIETPQNTALRFVLWVGSNPDCTHIEARKRFELLPETEQWRLRVAVNGVAEKTKIGRIVLDG